MYSITLSIGTVLWMTLAHTKELSELETLSSKPTRCTYERAYDMYGAHCVGLKLTKIPYLKGGIEILDLTDNKLKELNADMFSSYTSIKFLYLADNSIFSVDDDTFAPLYYLETLDLSMNVIQTIPSSILNLPSLRNLYLSGNPLVTLEAVMKTIPKPIKAPLEQLDLSNCRLFHLPDLGILPQLRFYNISYNPLRSLEAHHFARTCNLMKIDLTESTHLMKLCDQKAAALWLKEKRVYMILEDYSNLNSEEFLKCSETDVSQLNATYHSCKSEYSQVQSVKTSSNKWLTIGGGLAGFLVAFILLLYLMHKRNVIQAKKASKAIINKTPKHNPKVEGEKTNAALLFNIS